MGSAAIESSPEGINSPQALLLNNTNALFGLAGLDLGPDNEITGLSIQMKGDGSGTPINLGVNGFPPYVGPGPQLPPNLPGGIVAEVIPGDDPSLATLNLTGNINSLEIGGNIALGNLCVSTSIPIEGDIAGCTYAIAINFNPNATIDDGSCQFTGIPCENDSDGDGTCDNDEIAGCTNPTAINFMPNATDEDGSCEFGTLCTDETALNYSATGVGNSGPCTYPNKRNLKMNTYCALNDCTMSAGAVSAAFITEDLLSSFAPGTELRMAYSDNSIKAIPTDVQSLHYKQFTNPFGPYNSALQYKRVTDTAWTQYGILNTLCTSNFLSEYTKQVMASQIPEYSVSTEEDEFIIHPTSKTYPAIAMHLEFLEDVNSPYIANTWDVTTMADLNQWLSMDFSQENAGSPEDTEASWGDFMNQPGLILNYYGLNRPVEFRNYGVDADGNFQLSEEPMNFAQAVLIQKKAEIGTLRLDPFSNLDVANLSNYAANQTITGADIIALANLGNRLWELIFGKDDEEECEETECGSYWISHCVGLGERVTYWTEYCDCQGEIVRTEELTELYPDCCTYACQACECDEDADDDWGFGGDSDPDEYDDNGTKGGISTSYNNVTLVFENPNCPCGPSEQLGWASSPDGSCPCDLIGETGTISQHPLTADATPISISSLSPRVSDGPVIISNQYDFALGGKVLSRFTMNASTPAGYSAAIPWRESSVGNLSFDFGMDIGSTLYANSLRNLSAHEGSSQEFVFFHRDTVFVTPETNYIEQAFDFHDLSRQKLTIQTESDSVVGMQLGITKSTSVQIKDPLQNFNMALYDFASLDSTRSSNAAISKSTRPAQEGLVLNNAMVRLDCRAASTNQMGFKVKTPAVSVGYGISVGNPASIQTALTLVVDDLAVFTLMPGEEQSLTQNGITVTVEAAFCGVDVNSFIMVSAEEDIHVMDIQTEDIALIQEVGIMTLEPANMEYFEQWVPFGQDESGYPVYSLSGAVTDSPMPVVSNFLPGCTYASASNYQPESSTENGSCLFDLGSACPTDINGDGLTSVPDLLLLLGNFSNDCE